MEQVLQTTGGESWTKMAHSQQSSRDKQIKMTINQQLTTPLTSHVDQFCLSQEQRQFILAFETGINSRTHHNRSVTSGNPVSSRANVSGLLHLTPNPSWVHFPERPPQRGIVVMAATCIMSIVRTCRPTLVFCHRLHHGGHPYHTVAMDPRDISGKGTLLYRAHFATTLCTHQVLSASSFKDRNSP